MAKSGPHILQHGTALNWFYSLVMATPIEVSLLVVSKEDGNIHSNLLQ